MSVARAVSFDFDNTLLLSESCKKATMREVVSQYDGGLDVLVTVPTDSRTAPPGVTVTRYTIFESVARGLLNRGVKPPAGTAADAATFGEHMCSQFSSRLKDRLLEAAEVPGATALLKHLQAHKISCYVNTATPQGPIDELIGVLGWQSYFAGVYGHPGTKESNLQAIAVASGLTSPQEQLIHVGDGDNDCRAAADFGCRFIGVALEVRNGGTGAAGGGFSHACHSVVSDMHGAAAPICSLLGLPTPPASRSIPCRCCIDLGFSISESSTSWPTCEPLARQVLKEPQTTKPPGARSKQSFTMNGGTGTHLDAPSHFVTGGRTVDMLSPAELVAIPLVIIDCSTLAAKSGTKRLRDSDTPGVDGDLMVGLGAILDDEARHGRIPDGALVCVRTGWASDRYATSAEAYYNAPDPSDLDPYLGLPRMHFPGISASAAKFLVLERQAVGVGIDTLSPDGGGGGQLGFPAHHAILGNDRYILENLHLPADLPARGATASVAPLNIKDAPEAPARVWAILP